LRKIFQRRVILKASEEFLIITGIFKPTKVKMP
jgi:hypothetical protein